MTIHAEKSSKLMALGGLSQGPSLSSLSLPIWSVLGTPLLCTNYDDLAAKCRKWTSESRLLGIEFANTHVATLRRHDPEYREEEEEAFDLFIPDGTPLVWALRLAGAPIRSTVYGPAFMRRMLEGSAGKSTHYLLGGSPECGDRLRQRFFSGDSGVKCVGSFHGSCNEDGLLEGAADAQVIDEINRLAPDYIWLGLGGTKQILWLERHKQLLRRGIIFGVGFGFDVNAGLKSDSPEWMHVAGLTWLFRMFSEPRRLAWRYVRYNTLFLAYMLWDGIRGRAVGRPARAMKAERVRAAQ